jgi:hypothetical protein
MKRPAIKDGKIGEYVDFLEKKLERFSATNTRVKSYKALKHFIDTNSETLGAVDMSSDVLSDKEDKLADRASKFFKDLKDLNATLEALASSINPEEITGPERKYIKDNDLSLEKMIDEGKI